MISNIINKKKRSSSQPPDCLRKLYKIYSSDESPPPQSSYKNDNSYPHQVQSPHPQLRPYHSSSPIRRDSLFSPSPSSSPQPQPHYTSPSLFPSTITFNESIETIKSSVISSDSNNSIYYSPVSLKKSTIHHSSSVSTANYITQILDEDMTFSNSIVLNIIEDYNKYSNKISDIDYFISRSNSILSEYINNDDFYTNNLYQAYNFITLVNVVSFWIFYKFMIDDSSLNIHFLGYHLTENNILLSTKNILDMELDILNSIDYNILKYI